MNGYIDILELMQEVFLLKSPCITKLTICNICSTEIERLELESSWYGKLMYSWTAYIEYTKNNKIRPSIQGFMDFSLKFPSTRRMCRHNNASSESLIHSVPEIISFFLPNSQDNSILSSFQFNKSISIYDKNNTVHILNMKSIIYFGQSHFTSRLVRRATAEHGIKCI